MEVVMVKKEEEESLEWEVLDVPLPELEEDPLDIERWLTEHQLSSGQDGSDDRALLFGNNADLISDLIKTEYQFDTEEEYVSWSQLVLNGEVGGYQTEEYGGLRVPLVEVKLPEQEISIPAVQEKEEASTVELLKEFEAVLQDQVLTPPESPNQNSSLYQFYPTNQEFELEELVISRVEECTRGDIIGSTVGSGGCSPSSSHYSSTPSEGECDEDKGDPLWSPSPSLPSPQSSPHPEDEDEEEIPAKRRRRNVRSGPYTKSSPDERKLRKKEQNKNAATKYRQKKKEEVEKILDEEKGLKTHNEDLKGKLSDLQREIKYLKSLMREVFKAKGLIK